MNNSFIIFVSATAYCINVRNIKTYTVLVIYICIILKKQQASFRITISCSEYKWCLSKLKCQIRSQKSNWYELGLFIFANCYTSTWHLDFRCSKKPKRPCHLQIFKSKSMHVVETPTGRYQYYKRTMRICFVLKAFIIQLVVK